MTLARSLSTMLLMMVLAIATLACLPAHSSEAEEILGWRGNGTGRYPQADPPQTWSEAENILWKVKLPGGGYSSPVLVGDRLIVTAEPASVVCLSAKSGEILWQADADYATLLGLEKAEEISARYKEFDQERQAMKEEHDALRDKNAEDPKLEELKQAMNGVNERKKEYALQYPSERGGGAKNTSATPVSDGESVFALFNTGMVISLDLQGKRRWFTQISTASIGFGHSSSPALAGGKLLLHLKDLVALDPKTGEHVWRAPLTPRHGSPVVTQIGKEDVVITPAGAVVRAEDGKVLAEKLFTLSENSPVVYDGTIYAHTSGSIKAFPLPDSIDDPIDATPIWESDSTREQRMASALYHEGLLYCATRSGIMDVTDATTGDVLYRKRLSMGQVFSSATLAGDAIYLGSKEGKMLVLKPGQKFKEIALNQTEGFSSTPIFSGKRIYLRTNNSLYCIGKE